MTIATDLIPEPETARAAQGPSILYSWLVVVFLMVLYTSSFIDRQILSLLVKPIRADFHIDDFQYSLLAGFAFVFTYSLAGLPLGYIVDRWSRRGIVMIGVTVWSLMTAACGVTGSFGTLFVTRIGVGIGEATLSPASYSLISKSSAARCRFTALASRSGRGWRSSSAARSSRRSRRSAPSTCR
jgi:MFS family permease